MNEMSSPVLDLHERSGPVLHVDASPSRESLGDSGTSLVVGVMSTLAILAASVLVPLSRQALDLDSSHRSAFSGLTDLVQQALSTAKDGGDGTVNGVPAEAAGSSAKPTQEAPAPVPSAGDPFFSPRLAPLKGQRCFNFMPDGDNSAAREAFAELLWNKLEPDVRALLEERLDVCSPFESVAEGVIKAGGCRKSECGENDAHFFIDADGRGAIEYRVDGECRHAAEDGFTKVALLCKP